MKKIVKLERVKIVRRGYKFLIKNKRKGKLKMEEKWKAILAYVFTWVGGLVVLYGMKDNTRNTKIHAAQAIVIGIGYMVLLAVYKFIPIKIPFFSTIVYGLYAVCVIIGIVKATKEEEDPELPVVGDIAKSIFGKNT